jgi:uncharacterized repeat protein (TIGR02543 family)
VSDNTGKLIRKGYEFSGWNTLQDGSGTMYRPGATFIKGRANDTLYAKWDGNTYIVTYDDQGATTPVEPKIKTITVPETTVRALPRVPEKTGYAFQGWFSTKDGHGKEFSATTPVDTNITVYAKWTVAVISFTVTFNDQSASRHCNPSSMTITMPETTLAALPKPPKKSGYSFKGWNTMADGSGSEFTTSTPVHATITVYALWTPNSVPYTITYDSHEADIPAVPESQTVALPQTTVGTLPIPPQRKGHSFQGWYTRYGEILTDTTVVTDDMTVYGGWQRNR